MELYNIYKLCAVGCMSDACNNLLSGEIGAMINLYDSIYMRCSVIYET